jgi:hypothetical protein
MSSPSVFPMHCFCNAMDVSALSSQLTITQHHTASQYTVSHIIRCLCYPLSSHFIRSHQMQVTPHVIRSDTSSLKSSFIRSILRPHFIRCCCCLPSPCLIRSRQMKATPLVMRSNLLSLIRSSFGRDPMCPQYSVSSWFPTIACCTYSVTVIMFLAMLSLVSHVFCVFMFML